MAENHDEIDIQGEVGGIGDIAEEVIEQRFVRAYPPAAPPPGPTLYLPFRGGDLIVRDDYALAAHPPHPFVNADAAGQSVLYLGTLDGVPCLTYALPGDASLPEGYRPVGLRALYGHVGEEEYALAGYAAQLLHFHANHRFCPRCGSPTHNLPGGWAQECPVCGNNVYPPVSPAVLALVHDGDNILLAQKPGWGKRYSILAGFVEPGESLEGCVVREVLEESGVLCEDPQYWGSQPWPFPHQVMVGFMARYTRGKIKIDEAELSDARWFRHDALPELPPPLSLSRQLIDRWVASRNEN